MLVDVKVPAVGESITEGILVEWARADGDYVTVDEPLFVLETDKVTLTVNAENAGSLKIRAEAGATVKVGQVVGAIDTEAEKPARKASEDTGAKSKAPAQPPKEVPQSPGPALTAPAGLPAALEKVASAEGLEDLSPAVRRMVEEFGLDPASISGTGKGGRITKEDVVAHLSAKDGEEKGQVAPPQKSAAAREAAAPPTPATQPRTPGERRQTRTPLSPIRTRIAERMVLSQQSTATLTTFNECDCGEIIALRKKHREAFKAKHGVDLGFMGFFVKAVVDGLRNYPNLNAQIDGTEVVRNHFYDIGIAVAAEHGLAVPVLRDADAMSLAQVEAEIARLAKRVREKTVTLAELTGGTFSITNAGSYGALFGTPILNPPQSGILGMYAIQEKPVVREGQIVVRPVMVLALSYDHRLVDGKDAGLFLKHVAECVSSPGRYLLDL